MRNGQPSSFDIFSQAGKAVRDNPLLLNGAQVKRLLAVGTSQASRRLMDYVNGYPEAAGRAGVGHVSDVSYSIEEFMHLGITVSFDCNYPQSDEFIPVYPIGDAALDALNRWVDDGTPPLGLPFGNAHRGNAQRYRAR